MHNYNRGYFFYGYGFTRYRKITNDYIRDDRYRSIFDFPADLDAMEVKYAFKSFLDNTMNSMYVFIISDDGIYVEEESRESYKTTIDFRHTYFRKYIDIIKPSVILEVPSINKGRITILHPIKYEEYYGDKQVYPGTTIDINTDKPIDDANDSNNDNKCCCPCCPCKDDNSNIPDIPMDNKPYHYLRIYDYTKDNSDKFYDVKFNSELLNALKLKIDYINIPDYCKIDEKFIFRWEMG